MIPEIKIFDTPIILAESFAKYFADEVSKKNRYSIALSGGSTPKIIFEILAEEYSQKINWSKVHFFWGDERCVPPDSNESNYKMTKETLLDKINIPPGNIHRIKGENEPKEEAEKYSEEILKFLPRKNNLPQFDFTMLGLGEDGHTASIFPDRLNLFQSGKICEAVINPQTHQNRITITGQIINNSSEAAFFVTGKAKAEILERILNSYPQKNVFPASHVNLNNGLLFWYLDKESSSKLTL